MMNLPPIFRAPINPRTGAMDMGPTSDCVDARGDRWIFDIERHCVQHAGDRTICGSAPPPLETRPLAVRIGRLPL
jgi:hypothetical protein